MTASFYQDRVWIDRGGIEHRIADMEVEYARNTVAFLTRNAGNIQMAEEWKLLGTMPQDPSDGVMDAFDQMQHELHADPHKWLDSTPLMQALIVRAYGAHTIRISIPPKVRRRAKVHARLWKRLVRSFEPNGGLPSYRSCSMPALFSAAAWHNGRRTGLIEAYAILTGTKQQAVRDQVAKVLDKPDD